MAANATNVTAPAFRMEVSTANACSVIQCIGKLTLESADRFKNEVKRLLERSSGIVLDCAQLTYIDSGGLGALVASYASAQKAGCDFRLLNLPQRVLDLFGVTNLDKIFQGCYLNAP